MRFRFHAESAAQRGLRIIPEIPNFQLATIEGRNGIGKTLAARLLELTSGQQPFAALPHAWESLVKALGTVTILVDEFPDGQSMTFRLDSREWVDRSQADCAASPGIVQINGTEATWDEARTLLQVRRIAGDEGLSETIGRVLRERALQADQARRSLTPVVAEWGRQLSELTAPMAGLSVQSLLELRANHAELDRKLGRAEKALREARAAHDRHNEEVDAVAAIVDNGARLPELLQRYSSHLKGHRQAADRVADLERALTDVGAAKVADSARRKEVSRWSRLNELRRRQLVKAQLRELQILGLLNFTERPPRAEIGTLVAETKAELEQVTTAIRSTDLAGTIRNTQREIVPHLASLPSQARGETIAELERPVTAGQLLEGINVRASALEGVPKPGEAQALERRRSGLVERLRLLQALPEILSTTARKQELVDEARQQLVALAPTEASAAERRDTVVANLASERESALREGVEAVKALAAIDVAIGREGEVGVPDLAVEELDEADETAVEEAERALDSELSALLTPVDTVRSSVAAWLTSQLLKLPADLRAELQNASRLWLSEALDSSSPPHALVSMAEQLKSQLETLAVRAQQDLRDAELDYSRIKASRDVTQAGLWSDRLAIAAAATTVVSDDSGWAPLRNRLEGLLTANSLNLSDLRVLVPGNPLPDGTGNGAASSAFGAQDGNDDGRPSLDPRSPVDVHSRPHDVELRVVRVFETLASLADAVETAAAQVRDAWGTTAAYLNSTAGSLAPRISTEYELSTTSLQQQSYEPILRRWTENEIRRLLSVPELRQELFDDAERLQINLREFAVSWTTSDGRRRRRPLEAFSSGEQVFAYTRAKLDQLKPLRAQTDNVVVFLDEFGAFVARDRFSQLLAYVQSHAMGKIADQVIVMLPWSSSDAAHVALPGQTGDDVKRPGVFEAEGYFAVPAAPGSRR